MPIQDAHTHFFSRPFFETLAKLSPRDGEPEALIADVAAEAGLDVPSSDVAAHRDRWLAAMDAADVERMVTFASLPPEAEAVAEACASSDGRLLGYTVVDPHARDAPAFVERALGELGLRGILTFPAMHHVHPSSSAFMAVCEVAAKHAAPVIVHCGILKVALRDLFGLPRPYDLSFADPLGVVPAANAFPGTPFVIPHFGGGFFRETLMAADQCENIHVDTSSTNAWIATNPGLDLASVFRHTLDVLGAERILFGTDSSVFPRGYCTDRAETQRVALEAAGATPTDIAAIFGGNLTRMLPATVATS